MDEISDPPPIDELTRRLRDGPHDGVYKLLRAYHHADVERRKGLVRNVRSLAMEQPAAVSPVVAELSRFLTDEQRAVRLTTAKLFVTLAKADPDSVVSVVDELADRLGDEAEFYYVRARSAEAIGYVAVEHPVEVTTPTVLAELRIGLSFDEPEVTEKLSKALAYIALGNPRRLRHHVSTLGEHLDDENELVRYHLGTAIVSVGCEYPEVLSEVIAPLSARLDDGSPHVRGRAAEALGLLVRVAPDTPSFPDKQLETMVERSEELFAIERGRFALARGEEPIPPADGADGIGSLDGIREQTDKIVDEITSPAGECPHCGLALPKGGPLMCPRCGVPY
ncbi:hypothetical protein [Halostagnicola bangensis]